MMRSSSDRGVHGAAYRVPTTRVLPFVLSVIAGSTDMITYLGLGGLFSAHITGNIVILAAHVVAKNPAVLSYMLSVPVFMAVLFLTRLVADRLERANVSTLRPLLALQVGLLGGCLALCVTVGPWGDTSAVLAVVAAMLAVSAMAVQIALVEISLTGVPSTVVLTTNVTHLVLDCAELLVGRDEAVREKARGRLGRTTPVVVGFVVGCAVGAAVESVVGLWAVALPTGLAALALVMARVR